MTAERISNRLLASFKSMLASDRHVEEKGAIKVDKTSDICTTAFKPIDRKEAHPYLRKVKDEHVFRLKTDHTNVIAEIMLIEGLCEELKKAPDQAIAFHMAGRNDFASWVKDCVGDWYLGSRMEKVSLVDPASTKANLIKVLEDRIYKLKSR